MKAHDTRPASDAPIEVRDLCVEFPGGVRAVDDVNLRVQAHDLLVILGPSGAGKSTLLRSMNRLVSPTGGRVLCHGTDVTRASGRSLRRLRRRVGMIFQQFNLVGRLSVLDNVLAGRLGRAPGPLSWTKTHARWFSRSDRDLAMDALGVVGVAELADQRADTLSGGQQQRVAIARVLAQNPEVILADEPIASLDPGSAKIVLDTLRGIQRERGIPVVLNLHQVDHARTYATRIVGMRSGQVCFDGAPDELTPHRVTDLYRGATTPAHEPKPMTHSKQEVSLGDE